MPAGTQGDKASLCNTLLLLAHCTPSNILPKGIRAVATLLKHDEITKTTDTIVTTVMCKLDPILELVYHAADSAQKATMDTMVTADHLYRTGEETRDKLQRNLEVMREDIQMLADCIKNET